MTVDPATLLAIVARIERQLAELDRRTGRCALCRSAELRALLRELRGWAGGEGP